MPLINCEISLILTCVKMCKATTFAITDTKLYVAVIALSTQDNVKLLQQLKSGFKWTFDWNKYQSKLTVLVPTQYLDVLIDPSSKGKIEFFIVWKQGRYDTHNGTHKILSSNCRNKEL